MSASRPLVYLVLGTPGGGRRALVADLVENGLEPAAPVRVLLAAGEAADPADALLAARPNVEVQRWEWAAPGFPPLQAPAGATVFLLADPRVSPVDQVEALKPWLAAAGAELGRVLTVVDCSLAEREPALLAWYDACVHFSDAVLLTKRAGVANKWVSTFLRHYQSQQLPCHFIQLKKEGLANPALVLDPSPRRVSQYFDEVDELPDVEIETDDEEGEEDEDGLVPEVDPYFERMRGGRRVKEVPDLRDYLPAK